MSEQTKKDNCVYHEIDFSQLRSAAEVMVDPPPFPDLSAGETPAPQEPDASRFRQRCDVRQRTCAHGYLRSEGAILNPRCIHCTIEAGAEVEAENTRLRAALEAFLDDELEATFRSARAALKGDPTV